MYLGFLGLREKPFNLTPDPKFLYLNASYREALAALHYGIAERKGFVALVGEAGTGKTTLLRRLLSELPRETRSVLVLNPAIGFEELLRFILTDLGRPPAPGTTKLQMLEALNAELLDTLARGGNVVVLIDEAQDLTVPVLEELRLLSNLETAKEKILQFVIAGQPELDATLARPDIRQLRQRIAIQPRLRPLAWSEIEAYVGARVRAAGGDPRGLFTRPALYELWRFSRGVPRLVNVACDNALVSAYADGSRRVGWKILRESVRDLRPRRGAAGFFGLRQMRLALLLAAAAVAGGALGLVASRSGLWPGAADVASLPAAPADDAARDFDAPPVAARVEPPAAPDRPGVAQPPEVASAAAPAVPAAPAAVVADAPAVAPPAPVAAPPAVEEARAVVAPTEAASASAAPAAAGAGHPAPPVPASAEPAPAGAVAPPPAVASVPAAPVVMPRPPAAAAAEPAAAPAPAAAAVVVPAEGTAPKAAAPRVETAGTEPPAVEGASGSVPAVEVAPSGPKPVPPARRAGAKKPRRKRGDVLAGTPSFAAPAPVLDADAAPAGEARPEEGEGDAPATASAARERVAVRPGDTLSHLAVQHYGYISPKLLDEIRRANPSVDDRMLRPGQEIVLPRSEAKQMLEHLPGPGGETP